MSRPSHSSSLFRFLMVIPVPWVFVLAYLVGVGLQLLFPYPIHSSIVSLTSIISGITLFTIGAIIAAWSLVIFHKSQTTTVPGEKSTQLVTWGPYRFTRNPMYVNLTLAYLGEAGILKQVWPLVILIFVLAYVHWVIIPVEERRLKEVFGETYEKYCDRVRRWL